MFPKKILLEHRRAPGDVVVMTALVRDLKLTYPDIQIRVGTTYEEIWQNNPYLSIFLSNNKDVQRYYLNYTPSVKAISTERIHFLEGFHRALKKSSNLDIPLFYPKPDIHLSEEEKNNPILGDLKYWLIVSGTKRHITTKQWHVTRYQEVVNKLNNLTFVQVGNKDEYYIKHDHPILENTINLVGKTSLRELISLVYHSQGVVCPVTLIMHLAAAFDKPCVVLAGGREEPWWEAYNQEFNVFKNLEIKTPHIFIHTLGELDCCLDKGCWRATIAPRESISYHANSEKEVCKYPIQTLPLPVPACLDKISTEQVIQAVRSYF